MIACFSFKGTEICDIVYVFTCANRQHNDRFGMPDCSIKRFEAIIYIHYSDIQTPGFGRVRPLQKVHLYYYDQTEIKHPNKGLYAPRRWPIDTISQIYAFAPVASVFPPMQCTHERAPLNNVRWTHWLHVDMHRKNSVCAVTNAM